MSQPRSLEDSQDKNYWCSIQCDSASTTLNICAILSSTDQHDEAYEYAQKAVDKLSKAMRATRKLIEGSGASDRSDLENQWNNLATTATIAHYNVAVELEYMHELYKSQ